MAPPLTGGSLIPHRSRSSARKAFKFLTAAETLAKDDDRILGFTMIGAEAGEVMAVVQTAMLAGQPYQTLRDGVFTHPAMAEGLGPLFEIIPPRTASAG
jgi:pyruvate/2-oxoglutarate dehydrogenase complex dihydrolipoamide dehydrogenase (E3) component